MAQKKLVQIIDDPAGSCVFFNHMQSVTILPLWQK
jgi:hypothetical protein